MEQNDDGGPTDPGTPGTEDNPMMIFGSEDEEPPSGNEGSGPVAGNDKDTAPELPRICYITMSDTDTDSDMDSDSEIEPEEDGVAPATGEDPTLGNEGVASGGDSGAGPKGKGPATILSRSEGEGNEAHFEGPGENTTHKISKYHTWLQKQEDEMVFAKIAGMHDDPLLREQLFNFFWSNAMNIVPNKNFEDITIAQLEALWTLLDDVYYGGKLSKKCPLGTQTTVTFMDRRRIGGTCTFQLKKECQLVIELNVELILKITVRRGKMDRRVVNGKLCFSRLHCLVEIMFHESVHALMYCMGTERQWVPTKSRTKSRKFDAHGSYFKDVASRLYAQRSIYHLLDQPLDPNWKFITQEDVRAIIPKKGTPSDQRTLVKYKDKDGKTHFLYPIQANETTITCVKNPLGRNQRRWLIPYEKAILDPPENTAGPTAAP
tara:strand:+ start:103 stop:1401 length:1299 start_codon:yes stop_codon:yes gene_type:complete